MHNVSIKVSPCATTYTQTHIICSGVIISFYLILYMHCISVATELVGIVAMLKK